MRLTALTNHHPTFLKAAYAHPSIDLTDHERHIKSGSLYLTWDGQWRLWKMTPERVPIPRGRFKTINSALFAANR